MTAKMPWSIRGKLKRVLALALVFTLSAGLSLTPVSVADYDIPYSLEVFSRDGGIERAEMPYDAPPPGFGTFNALNTFEIVQLNGTGPDTQNIVITILGDGFTAAQQNAFVAAATTVANEILAFHPFSVFRDNINIYAIKVISNQSGASRDPNLTSPVVDNYFGSTFWADGVTQRLLYNGFWGAPGQPADFTKRPRANQVLNSHKPHTDVKVILVNTTTYGGAGGDFAVSSITPGAAGPVTIHEIGHSPGRLADEYWHTSTGEAVNRTANNNASTNKWRHWIGVTRAAAPATAHNIFQFTENAEARNWYRPHQDCMMRFTNRPFCYVCSSELVRIMANITGEPFHNQSTQTSITIPADTTRILNYAFWGSETLRTVEIPGSVTSIGNYAFLRCTGLQTIRNHATTPQNITGNNRFFGVTRSNVTLHVPAGTTAAYRAAGWTDFIIVEMGPPPFYGDVDGNGYINSADVTLLRRYVAHIGTGGTLAQFEAAHPNFDARNADVNGRDGINAADVTLLRRYVAATDPSSVRLGP